MSTQKGGREVVRMFPDYADSVLWFGGPVEYRFSCLTPELVRQFTEEGEHLAHRVADELGDRYEVELKSYTQGYRHPDSVEREQLLPPRCCCLR